MDRVRFGVIGAGMAGPYFGEALRDLPDTECVAIATTREESARGFAEKYSVPDWYTDWRRIIDRKDIDAVAVVTPPYLHEEMVVAAAQSGKHVITEKPMALNLTQCDNMIAACDKAGVTLGVIFMYRFMDTAMQIKKAVDEGMLGRLILGDTYAKFYRTQAYYDSAPWRGTWWGEGGGTLMSQTIHTIDLQIWIMGEVDSLCGFYDTMSHDIETNDLALAALRFKNGAYGTIVGSTATKPGSPRRLEIHGEKGTIILRDDDIVVWDVDGADPAEFLTKEKKNLGDSFSKPGYADSTNHRMQIRDFIDSIKEGRRPKVDGREGRRALKVLMAIYQSSRTGKLIKFPVQE